MVGAHTQALAAAVPQRGFVADHLLARGNPPDALQLLPAVHRVAAIRGRPPATVVADRGFGVAANDRALAGLGVRRIGLQRTGTPSRILTRVLLKGRAASCCQSPGAREPRATARVSPLPDQSLPARREGTSCLVG